MTAIAKNGQLYWTFEELDLEVVLEEIQEERQTWFELFKSATEIPFLNYSSRRVMMLDDVIMNIHWLIKRGEKEWKRK